MSRPTRTLVAFVAAAALAGCGSTVQQASGPSSSLGTDGLSGATAQRGPNDAAPGLTDGGVAGGQPVGADVPTTPGQASAPARVSPATGGPTAAADLSPARAKVTTPISLGILGSGSANGAAAALGAEYSTTTTGADVAKALVRYYNKHGGLAGRVIKPVEYTLEVTASNYQTEMQAACARFTQDNKVAAVISVLANAYFATYEQCLAKAGVPDFAGTTGSTDDKDLASFPGLVSVSAPTTNRRFTEMLDQFGDSGYVTAKNKVGVIVEDCPYNTRAYDDSIVPLAKSKGVSLMRRDINCINGFGDAAAAISAFGSAVLPFRTAGIDRVIFVSNFEGVGLLAFENNAATQDYTPSYALTSTTGGAALAAQFNDSQLRRMRGVGWTPVLDIAARVHASPATKRCRAMLASEGITPASKADDLLDLVCDQFFLLEATLTATSGRSGFEEIVGGLRSLGTTYLSPYSLVGGTDFSTRRDAPRHFAIWGYSTPCRCMDYLSSPR